MPPAAALDTSSIADNRLASQWTTGGLVGGYLGYQAGEAAGHAVGDTVNNASHGAVNNFLNNTSFGRGLTKGLEMVPGIVMTAEMGLGAMDLLGGLCDGTLLGGSCLGRFCWDGEGSFGSRGLNTEGGALEGNIGDAVESNSGGGNPGTGPAEPPVSPAEPSVGGGGAPRSSGPPEPPPGPWNNGPKNKLLYRGTNDSRDIYWGSTKDFPARQLRWNGIYDIEAQTPAVFTKRQVEALETYGRIEGTKIYGDRIRNKINAYRTSRPEWPALNDWARQVYQYYGIVL